MKIALIALGLYLLIFVLDKVLTHKGKQERKQFVAKMDAKIAATMEHIQDVEHKIEIYEVNLIGLPEDCAAKAREDYQKLKDKLRDLRNQLLDLHGRVHNG